MERKGDFISTTIRYKKETEVVTFQGREITLENLSPVFTPEQEAAKRRELSLLVDRIPPDILAELKRQQRQHGKER